MAVGVGAGAYVGWALETVSGTYEAPTHFMLLRNTTLNRVQTPMQRRPLRGIADVAGLLQSYYHVAGDLEVEVTEDILPVMLLASRMTIVKSGVGPYVYTCTPNANATPSQTASITVVKNGIVFGYTGCVIGSQTYGLDEGLLTGAFSIIGRDEATQTLPTPTYVTTIPFAYGNYDIQIPTSTSVFDTDTFSIAIEDNAEPQNRLVLNNLAARFVKYGERSIEIDVERDFESKTEYDAYKNLTSQSITILAQKTANASVKFTFPAAIKESYEIGGTSSQDELIRASVKYIGTYNAGTSKAAEIVITTATDITIP